MADIGNLAIKLTANAEGLYSGLQNAERALQSTMGSSPTSRFPSPAWPGSAPSRA